MTRPDLKEGGNFMRVHADRDSCVSSGQCVMNAPDVFDQDEDDGVVILLVEEPSRAQYKAVREAANLCPAAIIHLAESER